MTINVALGNVLSLSAARLHGVRPANCKPCPRIRGQPALGREAPAVHVLVDTMTAPITLIEDWNEDRTQCLRALIFREGAVPDWVIATLSRMLSHL